MLFLSETICGIILLEFTKFCFQQFHYLSVIDFNILLQQNKIMALQTGDKAPEILGLNQDGTEIRLSDFAGKKVVLYFYPKDNTPGCTAQACSLRDDYAELRQKGYEVIGVSADSAASHQKFIKKFDLPFNLITDEAKTLSEQFGTWGEKSMYGKKYMGMFRTTFIIDENGIIERIISPKEVNTKEHGKQVAP